MEEGAMNTCEDTIIALATVPGKAALAVIRCSGPDAIGIVDAYFSRSLSDIQGHSLRHGNILDTDGGIIDSVLVSVFRAPRSYTGEDVVEISTHGSPLIVQDVCALLFAAGMRQAEPGEFTLRAFMNGKMDLAQAEAVADIIHASSTAALKAARTQLDGRLSETVNDLRSMLIEVAALLELELDFSEEDVTFVDQAELSARIDSVIAKITTLIDGYRISRVVREGIHVALVGRPNVGKSSLLNFLLREARAIVSTVPGTTRDIIREQFEHDGLLYIITDTAGLRNSDDAIEQEGVERSRQCIREADIVLALGDPDHLPGDIITEILPLTDRERILAVHNKCDIAPPADAALPISAIHGQGIDAMLDALKTMALGTNHYSEKNLLVVNARHKQCLMDAVVFLKKAQSATQDKMSNEFIALDLREALAALGEIIGEVAPDDILNSIFTDFCIGK